MTAAALRDGGDAGLRPTRAGRAHPIPSLDGIRAVAVSLVFLAHSGLEDFIPGGLGVTVFFVLSGYLITTLMRMEFAASGRVNLRAFYLRRVLRLMPPMLVVLLLATLLASADLIDGEVSIGGLLSAVFYFCNYYLIASDFTGLPAGVGVMWSLAVEEHYYLLYPPLAIFLLQRGRPQLSAALLAALCTAVLAWRCWLYANGAGELHLATGTDTRVDSILIGCLLGMLHNPWLDPAAAAPPPRRTLATAIACMAVLLGTLAWRDEAFRQTLRYTLQSLAIAPLIAIAITHAGHWTLSWLNARPVVYIGGVSYAIYLAHYTVLLFVERHFPDLGWGAATLLATTITLALAEAIRRWIESPCARLRRRLRHPAPAAVRQTQATVPNAPL